MHIVDVGLYTKLSGDTALVALLSGGTPIFKYNAPPDTDRPYVVYFPTGGPGLENITPSELGNFVYAVKAVADTNLEAGQIDAAIKTCLHKKNLTVSGYTNYDTRREEEVDYVEDAPNGNPIYHHGAYYRIRIDD